MNKYNFKAAKPGDRPLAIDHNQMTKIINSVVASLHIEGITDSSGFHTKRQPPVFKKPTELYEVQSDGTGDGIYNCYKQKLLAAEWADTVGTCKFADLDTNSVEVFNLAEFDPEATYVRHLSAGDLITAWPFYDNTWTTRLIGIPFRQANADRPRIAYCKDDAGGTDAIACYLDTDATGTEIAVTCLIARGGTALNAVTPRLEDGDPIMVSKIGTTWYGIMTFQPTEDCDCYTAP